MDKGRWPGWASQALGFFGQIPVERWVRHLGMLLEDDEDAVDVNVLCICDCQSGTAPHHRRRAATDAAARTANAPLARRLSLLSFRPSLQILNVHSPSSARARRAPSGRTGTSQNTPPLPSPSRPAGAWTAATTSRRVHQTDTLGLASPTEAQSSYGRGLRLFREMARNCGGAAQ